MMLLSALFAVATATTPNCPVTCEQVQVDGTRVNHTPDSPDPHNYATSLTHSTSDDSDWKIKVTHKVYDANTGSYKHHRCYKTTNMAVPKAQRCLCECITSSNNNPNKKLATFWTDRTAAQATAANTNF